MRLVSILRSTAAAAMLLVPTGIRAQALAANPADVGTIESIITTLYSVISGPVGQPRQWDRFASLMHANARLSPTACPPTGACVVRVLTPAEYRQRADSSLTAMGFREVALVNRVERFGSVAQVFSSYESFRGSETTPFSRGINSIQLFWDGTRWWVFSIFWDSERPGNPLPAEFTRAKP
jgi:hypothetical protein